MNNDWKPNQYETLRQVLDREADNFRHGSYNKPQFVEKIVSLFNSYNEELRQRLEGMKAGQYISYENLGGASFNSGFNEALDQIINLLSHDQQ